MKTCKNVSTEIKVIFKTSLVSGTLTYKHSSQSISNRNHQNTKEKFVKVCIYIAKIFFFHLIKAAPKWTLVCYKVTHEMAIQLTFILSFMKQYLYLKQYLEKIDAGPFKTGILFLWLTKIIFHFCCKLFLIYLFLGRLTM